ncbi:acVLRF1 family peptidyl-tRNA hydrolase [Serinicoccus marinus]|uniref:acVLRF1 family peptidyl-tRNA hydrolase n=1 Tax=Serinicoccus marinus TaxID=247333 RepID=UPI00122DDC8A|nr:acVLRF1 family peptidyl-tRNA hydrolase [Serinicoccus marinus]
MSPTHPVEVAPERLDGWVARFTASHGEVTRSVAQRDRAGASPSTCLHLAAADGSWARLTGWQEADLAAGLAGFAAPPPLLVLLVRRGGYAVALVSASGDLVAHKVGTRHVQSRTAAGGWSQQRYARRRGHQADALVEAVVGHTARLLHPPSPSDRPHGARRAAAPPASTDRTLSALDLGGLVLGGDRSLIAGVMSAIEDGPSLPACTRNHLAVLPRRELYDLPDPRRSVLDDAVRRGRAVLMEVHNA